MNMIWFNMHEKIYVSCTHPENETGHDKSGHDKSGHDKSGHDKSAQMSTGSGTHASCWCWRTAAHCFVAMTDHNLEELSHPVWTGCQTHASCWYWMTAQHTGLLLRSTAAWKNSSSHIARTGCGIQTSCNLGITVHFAHWIVAVLDHNF